jgi:alkane 1-monooxygenase
MRSSDIRFGAALVYIAVVAFGAAQGGLWGWSSIVLGGTLYPVFDALPWGRISGSSTDEVSASKWSASLLIVYAVAQSIVIVWVLHLTTVRDYALWEWVGIALSLGTLTGGIGIPAAHELIHRKDRLSRTVGLYLLALVIYMHFRIEHIHGHHLLVATPDDPATARRGEGLWTFIPRSIAGQLRSAYRIEERLRRSASGRIRRANRVAWYAAVQASLLAAVAFQFGWPGLLVMLVQSAMAIVFLESTNYIEHYGLTRMKLGSGYEPVSPQHSWNTNSLLTNSLAFNLGLHADHHANPQRAFPQLRQIDAAPQLPAGYLTMLSIAAVPMLWRAVMDPRLDRLAASSALASR